MMFQLCAVGTPGSVLGQASLAPKKTGASDACPPTDNVRITLRKLADDRRYFAEYLGLCRIDRFHEFVLGLQSDAIAFKIKRFEGGFPFAALRVVGISDHNIAVIGDRLGIDDDKIAVEDGGVHHG